MNTNNQDNESSLPLETVSINRPVFIREVTARYTGVRRMTRKISGPADVKEFAGKIIKDNVREHFVALFLDGSHQVISYSLLFTGTATSVQVHPRELFQHAILVGSVAIVVAHNHPSGNLDPSPEDNRVTRMLFEAGELLGIKVLDHVVFTDHGFVSLKDRGLLGGASCAFK